MPHQNRIVRPGRKERTVLTDAGEQLSVPDGWTLLPPGDGPLTKLVKGRGPTWLVRVKFRNRFISQGIWASEQNIWSAKNELAAKRSAPGYTEKRQQQLARKELKQKEYVDDFCAAVIAFLDFAPRYEDQARVLARSVTKLATPVGSGTVARTKRIPLEDRAERAVIAWMRHQATAYDSMTIGRVKGRRRQVRRELASQSLKLLQPYRDGHEILSCCPLRDVLKGIE